MAPEIRRTCIDQLYVRATFEVSGSLVTCAAACWWPTPTAPLGRESALVGRRGRQRCSDAIHDVVDRIVRRSVVLVRSITGHSAGPVVIDRDPVDENVDSPAVSAAAIAQRHLYDVTVV